MKARRKKETQWGLFDTVDKLWLGDASSSQPRIYSASALAKKAGKKISEGDTRALARLAAEVACRQLGWMPGRVEARVLDPGPMRKKDTVRVKEDTLTAIKRLEEGKP